MLKPLFDKDSELVAWIDPDKHIFDTDMDWVAYISNGHARSAESGNWCGPVSGHTCLDQSGRVIAWSPGSRASGTITGVESTDATCSSHASVNRRHLDLSRARESI